MNHQTKKRCWNCRCEYISTLKDVSTSESELEWAAGKKSCDRQAPSCGNCLRRGITCEGYGMLLSWPKESDNWRSIVCIPEIELPIHKRPLYFIDLGHRDLELSFELRNSGWSGQSESKTNSSIKTHSNIV